MCRWREALTADYLHRWRAADGSGAKAGGMEGASQRVQDDCYKLSAGIDSFGQGILAATLQALSGTRTHTAQPI